MSKRPATIIARWLTFLPARRSVVRVPDEVPPPLAASAACALRTVMNGYEQLGLVESHETVVILGSGPLGLYAVVVAPDGEDASASRAPALAAYFFPHMSVRRSCIYSSDARSNAALLVATMAGIGVTLCKRRRENPLYAAAGE